MCTLGTETKIKSQKKPNGHRQVNKSIKWHRPEVEFYLCHRLRPRCSDCCFPLPITLPLPNPKKNSTQPLVIAWDGGSGITIKKSMRKLMRTAGTDSNFVQGPMSGSGFFMARRESAQNRPGAVFMKRW